MRNQRSFSPEFKRQMVEELLSGVSTVAQLCRRHRQSSSFVYHWKRQYAKGTYDNEPTQEAALEEHVRKRNMKHSGKRPRSLNYLVGGLSPKLSKHRGAVQRLT